MAFDVARAEDVLSRLESARILVVGDLILDQYVWGEVNRISPEAPIPVVEVLKQSFSLGGAANVAHNARVLGAAVDACGVVGEDEEGRRLLGMLEEKGIGTDAVVTDPSRPTTLKTRIVAHRQQVVRVDREDCRKLEEPRMAELLQRLKSLMQREEAAIVLEDYGKGVIQEALLREIVPLAKQAGKIVTVDPKRDHFALYEGVTAITPNRQEAEAATGIRIADQKSLYEAGAILLERLSCAAVLIKLGERGMCLFESGRPPYQISARAREVFDVSGAGDTVIAVFTTALASGASMREAAVLSNLAGGLVVEKLGTATVTREEIRSRLREIGI